MEIKNIIFDLGGVLIDWNPNYLYENVFTGKEELNFFLSEICNAKWNQKQDEGRPFKDAIKELTHKFPRYKSEIEMYHYLWIKMIGGDIPENTSLLKKLKANYRLLGLTNWSAETFHLVFKKYSFFKELENIVISGVEKVVKPNHKIYQILLERYELRADQSLFIDDNKSNIEAAKEIGFQVIHFTDGMNLENELQKIGIKTT